MRVTPQIPPVIPAQAGTQGKQSTSLTLPQPIQRIKAASGVGTRFFKDLLLMDIDGFHHVALLDG